MSDAGMRQELRRLTPQALAEAIGPEALAQALGHCSREAVIAACLGAIGQELSRNCSAGIQLEVQDGLIVAWSASVHPAAKHALGKVSTWHAACVSESYADAPVIDCAGGGGATGGT